MVANNATSSGTPDPRDHHSRGHDPRRTPAPCAHAPRVPPVPGSNAQRSEPELVPSPSPSSSSPIPNSPPHSSNSSAASASSSPSAPSLCHSVTPSLLPAFIAANYNITALLSDSRFTPDEIMAFLESPETQSRLTNIAKTAHLGLTIRAAEARHTAINVLEQVAKESDDLVEKRRAAFALYRATASPLIPAPGSRSTRAADTTPAAPPPPPPAPRGVPHPDFEPHDVLRIVSQSLLRPNNNDPEVGSGLATLNAFLTPDATVCGTQLPTESDITTSPNSNSSSSPHSDSPLRSSDSSATSAFSSSSLAARRIEALRQTPIAELDGHNWYLRENHDEVGDARIKVALWYVPKAGGTRHFFFTLETRLFHFPDADPDCWYITSIDQYDPFAHRRELEEQDKERREQEKRQKQQTPNPPTPPADDKPP